MISPLVSIIVPVYNTQNYLRECALSIVNQTYKNLQIIFINDGSTDISLNICKDFEKLDSRVLVVSQPNSGLSVARNTGIKFSKGEYIAFIDSDDFVDKDFVKDLLSACLIDSTLVSVSDIFLYYSKDNKHKVNDLIGESKVNLDPRNFNKMYHHVAWRKLYHKSIFNSIKFPDGLLHEDIGVWYGVMSLCHTISIVNKPLYFYRQNNPESITSKNIDQIKRCTDGLSSFSYGFDLVEKLCILNDLHKIHLIEALLEAYYLLPFYLDQRDWRLKQASFILRFIKYKKYMSKSYQNKLVTLVDKNDCLFRDYKRLKKHLKRFFTPFNCLLKWFLEPFSICKYFIKSILYFVKIKNIKN